MDGAPSCVTSWAPSISTIASTWDLVYVHMHIDSDVYVNMYAYIFLCRERGRGLVFGQLKRVNGAYFRSIRSPGARAPKKLWGHVVPDSRSSLGGSSLASYDPYSKRNFSEALLGRLQS